MNPLPFTRQVLHLLLQGLLLWTTSAALAEDPLLQLNMRDAELRNVIQWLAEQTRRQIVIDPRVRGRITVLSEAPMTLAQAEEVLLTALEVHGYAASEHRGIMRITPASQARDAPRDVVQEFDRLRHGRQVVHVVRLKALGAAEAEALLQPLAGSQGRISALDSANALLLADDGAHVQRLVELLRLLDDDAPVHLDILPLRHADATRAVELARSLFASTTRAGEAFSLTADPRSNSVLVAGEPRLRSQAAELIARIDQPLEQRGETRVLHLHYLDAQELAPVLKTLAATMQEQARDQADSTSSMSVEAARASNALVLAGSPHLLKQLSGVVAELDRRRPQVLVEAIIVEVSQQLMHSLGVEWNTALGGTGLAAGTALGLRDGANPAALPGPGLAVGIFRHGDLRALLRALSTSSDANILSTPSVVALDNQEASILVGSNIPIITGQATGRAADTDQPFTTFERQDIGISLRVRPQVNRDRAITLDLEQEVEHLTDHGDARDVVTNKRSLATRVILEHDSTLVLGGLIADERRERVRKVPLLGDLPLVGGLFRSTTEELEQRNLMVFVHPLILDESGLAEALSQDRYEALQALQEDGAEVDPGLRPLLRDFHRLRRDQRGDFELIRPASDAD